ncbi:3-deoxy-manno-octulosonate cytidylyltransferase [Neorhodopirellula pilleata]|nr:3-deoxy-manno-octulosonate cytidylyltransferase [Neorhodopirellula pilleata]
MRIMIVIPARLASGRLSEKLLLRAAGKSVLQWTYEAAKKATITDRVIVAADDPRLVAEVDSFGGEARLTSVMCQSGTDRIAEIALRNDDVDLFVNVQGDEPEIAATTIDTVAGLLASRPDADIATAICPITSERKLNDPACVKVIMGDHDRAICFSRAPVPFARDGLTPAMLSVDPSSGTRHSFWQHIGLYAYRRDFLLWFATQPPGRLEQIEKLEQLRAIEAGKTIIAAEVPESAPGIDTLEDFREFKDRVEG